MAAPLPPSDRRAMVMESMATFVYTVVEAGAAVVAEVGSRHNEVT